MSEASTPEQHRQSAPECIRFSVLTVSDTRTLENDSSGQMLVDRLQACGHLLVNREIVPDEVDSIAGSVRRMVQSQNDAVLLTGGTGISARDRTPEAVRPLMDAELPGFGELFRMLSYEEIGAAAMLSRAFAGRIGEILVFCLPGSTAAVRLAVDKLLIPEISHLVHHSRG